MQQYNLRSSVSFSSTFKINYFILHLKRLVSSLFLAVVLYHMKGILKELDMTQNDFKDVCILSGTDYSYNSNSNANNEKMMTIKNFLFSMKPTSIK